MQYKLIRDLELNRTVCKVSIAAMIFCILPLCIALLSIETDAHKEYIDRIPNGDAIMNPCSKDFYDMEDWFWNAVGHMHPHTGTEKLNPFGQVKFYYYYLHKSNKFIVHFCHVCYNGTMTFVIPACNIYRAKFEILYTIVVH